MVLPKKYTKDWPESVRKGMDDARCVAHFINGQARQLEAVCSRYLEQPAVRNRAIDHAESMLRDIQILLDHLKSGLREERTPSDEAA